MLTETIEKADGKTMRYFKLKKKKNINFKVGRKHTRNIKGAKESEAFIRKKV